VTHDISYTLHTKK